MPSLVPTLLTGAQGPLRATEATCANLTHPCRFGTELSCAKQTRG